MSDVVPTLLTHVVDRLTDGLPARLIVQPFASIMLAIIDGLHDADQRRPPYLRSLFRSSAARRPRLLAQASTSLAKVLALALILDMAYQFAAFRFVDIGEALLVALVLAVTPYVMVRGAITRFATDPTDPA